MRGAGLWQRVPASLGRWFKSSSSNVQSSRIIYVLLAKVGLSVDLHGHTLSGNNQMKHHSLPSVVNVLGFAVISIRHGLNLSPVCG